MSLPGQYAIRAAAAQVNGGGWGGVTQGGLVIHVPPTCLLVYPYP